MTANDPRPAGEAAKVRVNGQTPGNVSYCLWCPACEDVHRISDGWGWNGDLDRPTFTPSILVGGVQWGEKDDFYKPSHAKVSAGERIVCHSFLTDGVWNFLADCTHAMAGRSVPMVALPEWLQDGVA